MAKMFVGNMPASHAHMSPAEHNRVMKALAKKKGKTKRPGGY